MPLTNPLGKSFTMGWWCLPVGLLAGFMFGIGRTGGDIAFTLSAPIAAFISGSLGWWVLVTRRHRTALWRGALAGMVIVIMAHWLTLEMAFLSHNVWLIVSNGDPRQRLDLYELTVGTLGFTILTVITVGCFTMPIGATLGAALIAIQRRDLGRGVQSPNLNASWKDHG
jgi:hypothetical protein